MSRIVLNDCGLCLRGAVGEKISSVRLMLCILQTEWEHLYWAMKEKATAAASPAVDLQTAD